MSLLFTPWQLRELELRNRIVLSPMCQYAAVDGCASDWHLMHLGQFMVSGVALVMVEMTNVQANGRISPHCLGLYDEDCERALQCVVDYCRELSDTPMGIQLAHAGRKASCAPPWLGRRRLGPDVGGWGTVGPTAISHRDDIPAPMAMSAGDIDELVDAFVAAARRADRIGFDAIELHGAHGYLLHQFLSPLSNRREDDYGGTPENRMRLPLRVFDAVRDVWPARKPLGMRLSAIDWADNGLRIEDTVTLAKLLGQRGCDWVDVSSGGIGYMEKIETGPGYQVGFAEQVKRETGLSTIAVGMITEPKQAEDVIAFERADMVALARGLLFNPRWPWHAALELGVEVNYPERYQRCAPDNRNAF